MMRPVFPVGRVVGPRAVLLAGAVGLLVLVAIDASAAESVSTAATRATRDPLSDLPSYGESLKRMVIALLAIIGALLVVAKLLPRLLGSPRMPASGKMIDVVESCRLEPRKSIYLVRVADQYFLVGSTGDRLETLAGGAIDSQKLTAALRLAQERAASTPKPSRPFTEILKGKRASSTPSRTA